VPANRLCSPPDNDRIGERASVETENHQDR
jgi:hypothetical protein